LRRPLEVRATSVVPEGPPVRFEWEGVEHAVARCAGPERIETGWWRLRPVRRDYYRVETVEGGRFWLFRERASGTWFVHGVFE
jgi:protein ImuB